MESYSHGNYILYVAHFLLTVGLLALIVFSGFGATLMAWAGRLARSENLKVATYAALFTLVSFTVTLPFSIYSGSYASGVTASPTRPSPPGWAIGGRGCWCPSSCSRSSS